MSEVIYNKDRTVTLKVDAEEMAVISDINKIVREHGHYGCDYTILKKYAPTWTRDDDEYDEEYGPSNHLSCLGYRKFGISDKLVVIGEVTEEDGPNEYYVKDCDMIIQNVRFNVRDTMCNSEGTMYRVGDWLKIILE